MQMRTLGRTGLNVSIAGLGCGGPSRLGTAHGASDEQAADIVRLAMDLGVNYLDTAEMYGTEKAVGLAIAGKRDRVIVSTKTGIGSKDGLRGEDEILASLDGSLERLGIDCVDVYHMHGVSHAQLDHAEHVVLPALLRARDAGKFRFIAVSEVFGSDTKHLMLQSLFERPIVEEIDVIMVGFNLLNHSARETVFPQTFKHEIGTEVMFAVRRALSQPEKLRETIEKILAAGQLDPARKEEALALRFLLDEAATLPEAAYRFCAHEPGVSVVLTGTGNAEHLRENLTAIQKDPLSEGAQATIASLFGRADCISG
jgi:aryl-alcohol dehydrogenase-like predicted oxidoreductase